MADWRQIQVRIRKARVGEDAPEKLTQLFDKTQDGMVAFELATLLEKLGRMEEAVLWYRTSAERFRRADWKQKAKDALVRLGAPVPAETAPEPLDIAAQAHEARPSAVAFEAESVPASIEPEAAPPTQPHDGPATPEGHKRRRRGRRGGRGRRRGRATESGAPAPQAPQQAPALVRQAPPMRRETPPRREPPRHESPPPPMEPEPDLPARGAGHPGIRGGDPALSSRLVQLESRLRRLLGSAAYELDQAEEAPAGPGVYILSDSDQVTHYYVEACDTLRIALANVAKSGRAGRGESSFSLRPGLAEHLGISETKVKDYVKKHCVVRWVQLDEGAPHLAHFAVALLHPVLNQ